MFTAKERVERNGFLVAYAGETMSDDEAARRGLIEGSSEDSADVFSVGTPAAENDQTAVVEPPIDDEWAEAAGMSLEECLALWNEDPNAVLYAIKANLAAADGDNADGAENAGAENNDGAENAEGGEKAADDGAANDGNPSKKELREECEKRGIKAPKNATIAQLEALLGD